MSAGPPLPCEKTSDEVLGLIAILHQTGQRLEELTGGEVDTVADIDGRTFVLLSAQEQLRHREAARQAAILNALPTQIALLDAQGIIICVNDAWRRFVGANALQGPGYSIGFNYLQRCDSVEGECAPDACKAAAGIRSVLNGQAATFSIEYHFRWSSEQRWFLMTVTTLADGHQNGAVVMHLDITERKRAEIRISHLNRVYAVLSQINALIVRARNRDELFRETCRIAIEEGGFRMCVISLLDQNTKRIVPVASAGKDEALLATFARPAQPSEHVLAAFVALSIAENTVIVSNDCQNDPRIAPRAGNADAGVRSLAVLPLTVAGQGVGVLVLMAGEIAFFHDEEMKLLTELAGDVAFAIDHIEKEERIRYLASYDVLTGLANQSLFIARVHETLLSAGNDRRKKAVFVLDVERFKAINDAFGVKAADQLLKQVAEFLVQCGGGDSGRFARIGADRFAVLGPDFDDAEQVGRYVEQTHRHLFRRSFAVADKDLRISVKIGIALFPDDGADADTLLRNAEAALKKAKSSGEHYLFFTQAMTARVAERLSLENKLRQALEEEEFVLHYQPKVNLVSGRLTGAEALIRWNDPRTGLVPPGHFISILEETGLIQEVGRWALHKAIDDYLRWLNVGLNAVRISVNVSPLQLRNRDFITEIRQVVGIDVRAPAGLELEITESLIMGDVLHSISSLKAIRELGVTIALDDFGTGFSSLGYLSKLPVDTLKIDRSFVIEMTDGPKGLALISTIINLARSMKLNVVAEGVETEEQSRLLRLLNCDEMQGYLFSRPVPSDVFESRFLSRAI